MPETISCKQAVDEYLQRVAYRLSKATVSSYKWALRSLAEFLDARAHAIQMVVPADIEAWAQKVLKAEYARSTVNNYSVAARAFVRYAAAHKLLQWTDGSWLPLVEETLLTLRSKRSKRLPKLPAEAAVLAIRQAAGKSPLPAPRQSRNIALVEFLYSSGCRIDEACKLRVRDINLLQREARVTGKGDKERVVFFSHETASALSRYWRERALEREQPEYKDAPAFARHDPGAGKKKPLKRLTTQGARNVILELAVVAGLDRFTPHSFRHYFATRMLDETGQLDIVQEALGHANIETTRVYAKTNPAGVRAAHRQVFGQ